MIRGIIFDCGGVLVTLGEQLYRAEVAGRLGLPELPSYYNDLMPELQRGEISEEALWEAVAGHPLPLESFDDIFRKHFLPDTTMLETAREIRRLGIPTALLSNTQTSHAAVLKSMGFMADFDPVALSCEIGFRKPEPKAYQHVLWQMELPPHEVAFVDDFPQFAEAARSIGLHAIWHQGDVAKTRDELMKLINR